ncbi:efflux RND transporter periplasmic adaptor subunit [Inhella sp.]|uniref:efflux RND transporter periplasmic adaptor subunit n=1 Tax=Inhella sp. TaxID=1921806 RepID=UPI0035B1E823
MLRAVTQTLPQSQPPSGAAMDRLLPGTARGARRTWALALLAALLLGGGAWALRLRWPALPVVQNPQLGTVRAGEFRDELQLRARAEPLRLVQLDAQEAGRVEAVLVQDGAVVQAGQLLYRLHSREQEQLLMQRAAEVAQQQANAALQRSAWVSSLGQSRRELAQLRHQAEDAALQLQRQRALAAEGFVSTAALEQAERQADLSAQLLEQAREDQAAEQQTRRASLAELDRAVGGLQQGLALLQRARAQWSAPAPISGRLSGFALQPGQSLRPGDRLGRIDDLEGGLQLAAEVDEFYLPRLSTGLGAESESGPLVLVQTLPQVQGGKARALFRFSGATPPLRPGQTVELRLQLSAPQPALLLPDGPGVHSPLYVLKGRELHRRSVQLGRRAAGLVEVLAGLQAGEQVLLSATPHTDERLSLP